MVIQQGQEIQIIILGSLGMIILSLAIVVFFFLYQRKIQRQQLNISQIEVDYQKNLIRSEIISKEKERNRIAQELHDEIGASLTAIKMNLSYSEMTNSQKEELENSLQETIQGLRRISFELLPPILNELGLSRAVSSLAKEMEKAFKVPIETQIEDPNKQRYDQDIELGIYRVVQEVLSNILKYSEPKTIRIKLKCSPKEIHIIIDDDGIGFIPTEENRNKPDSHGLKNIYSRLQLIEGAIYYKLNEKGGTTTTIYKSL